MLVYLKKLAVIPSIIILMFAIDRLTVDKIHCSAKTGGLVEYIIAVFAVTFNNETVAFVFSLGLLMIPWSLKNMVLCSTLPMSGLLITFILKKVFSRPRPALCVARFESLIFDFRGKEKNHSMPSGDSLQAATFWTLLWYFNTVSWLTALIFIALTMIARIYYMCHYPTDTIVGVAVGILNFFIMKTLYGVA